MAVAGERAGRGERGRAERARPAKRPTEAALSVADAPGNYGPGGGKKLMECVRDAIRARHYSGRGPCPPLDRGLLQVPPFCPRPLRAGLRCRELVKGGVRG